MLQRVIDKATSKKKQTVVALLLAYASYITFWCPCDRVISCHLKDYVLSVGTASAIVLHDNLP